MAEVQKWFYQIIYISIEEKEKDQHAKEMGLLDNLIKVSHIRFVDGILIFSTRVTPYFCMENDDERQEKSLVKLSKKRNVVHELIKKGTQSQC